MATLTLTDGVASAAASSAWATADDLSTRYDARTLADLASDSGEPAASLADSARIQAVLADAAGRILAVCASAKLYSAADLDALTGPALALLKRLNCDLAMGLLLRARPEKLTGQESGAMSIVADAENYLEMIRKGLRIFDTTAAEEAGLPSVDGPTAVTFERLNLITSRSRGYYPDPGQRLPIGRA